MLVGVDLRERIHLVPFDEATGMLRAQQGVLTLKCAPGKVVETEFV